MNTVYLVDGSSIFFRAYHAIPNLRRSDGMATNALYGYVATLRSLIREYQPRHMVVAFDRPEPTFRKEQYEEYKANRAKPPEDLAVQIPYIKEVTEKLGISQIEMPGYEADDLIGTLAVRLAEQGYEVIVVSGDKDLLQLVSGSVKVLRLSPNKNTLYAESDVVARYGVPPVKLIDVLGLMGDASDNVPGVPGIGEKTAIALIQEFGSMESLYENLDRVSGTKRRDNLKQYREQAFLSRALVTIKTDVPLPLENGFIEMRPVDERDLRRFYEAMEFRSFAAELTPAPVEEARPVRYEIIQSAARLADVVRRIQEQGACAVDTETTSLETLDARLVGISFSVEDDQGWYIPLGHSGGGNIPREDAWPLLQEVLESESVRKTGHHVKFDQHILANEGIRLRGLEDDTLIAAYLVYPQRDSQKLDDLAQDLLGMRMTPITDLIGTGRGQKCMADVAIAQAGPYACEDTDAAWRLRNVLRPRIQEYGLEELYRRVEIPLIQVLVDMERQGVRVDTEILEEQSRELGEEMKSLEKEIFQSIGREFNLNSPSQLAQILYDDLKVLEGRKRSTRADVLEKLADEGVPIARQILEYRHRQKIKSTYLDALPRMVRPDTGRVHTTYNQSVVNTGRISSNDPNLQNIPIRTDLGRRVRKAFVASPGCVLISLDYSQIELRVLAHMSQDPGLLQAFAAGEDIHARTAAEIFGVPLPEVTPDMRRKAKEINFGLNYGMSPYGLARRLSISTDEAASYIQAYFTRYPRVQTYMSETIAFAQQNLYVKTLMGRRIPTPGVRDSHPQRQENARRAAINAPIQGSAADLMKKAMVDVHAELQSERGRAAILLTVHDELVLEAVEDRAEEIVRRCRDRMEQAMRFDVPTPVETSIGPNWADLN